MTPMPAGRVLVLFNKIAEKSLVPGYVIVDVLEKCVLVFLFLC